MARHQYDEAASATWNMDVVHEVNDAPASRSQWVEAMRRLNAIDDPLARKIVALHRDCGSGSGVCDDVDEAPYAPEDRAGWGCETMQIVAEHFNIRYP